MDEQKVLQCQKYYVFKIRDIVNNSFHTLEEKRIDCLIQYLDQCISTYDDYRMALEPSKLKNSYEGLIEGMDFQMQKHPFRKLDLYRNDFAHLHKLIKLNEQQRDKELHNIHRDMVSLRKKLSAADMIGHYLMCLKHEENYQEMDNLMEALISDLLNKGYSLTYLIDWFKKQQDEFMRNGQDVSIIENLRELDREVVEHTIYIKYIVNSETQFGPAFELLRMQFTIQHRDEVSFSSRWSDKDFYIASKKYRALDVTKAISMASKEFSAVKELFDMWQGTIGCIRDDLRYGWTEGENFNLMEVKKADNVKMLGYVDSYYRKQMDRFLKLRVGFGNEDFKVLERILYTLNTAKTYKIQNRFLNFWSALEYVLYPFPRFTIIEKARVVVPEVFSLFYIKNKINIFWSRLIHYLETRYKESEFYEVVKFVDECIDVGDGGYDTKKVIAVFQDKERVQKIAENFSKHVVLHRELSELEMLINSPQKAVAAIEDYYEGIKHDLNYIYRLRNQLIHSTKDTDDSLEHISMRLYRYVNSVLSTILYYKEKNSEYTIMDILNSIDATYQDYISVWKAKKAGKKESQEDEKLLSIQEAYNMVRPSYLFIE